MAVCITVPIESVVMGSAANGNCLSRFRTASLDIASKRYNTLAAVFLNSNLCPKFFRAAIPPIVPFRVRFDNNNTIRTLELSLQAAGTDG